MASAKLRRELVEARLSKLIGDFEYYLDAFDKWASSTSPQLRLHRQTISRRCEGNSAGQAIDSDQFLLSLRSTLKAWRLGRRGSRLASQAAFDEAVRAVRAEVGALDGLRIGDPASPADVGERLWQVIESLGVVDNRAKLVAGTKTLHHLLPDLVVPVDRRWTGMFFKLHPSEWQNSSSQRRTFLQMHRDFCEIARQVQPQQYVGGRLWRTSRTKVIDNGLIGFCIEELSSAGGEQTNGLGQALSFRVDGFPPTKNEALSMLGVGHSHAPRVVELLRAASVSLDGLGFSPIESGPVALEVVVHAPKDRDAWDATNYLGGIADVLEEKSRRGALEHLGELDQVWLYRNDRQIKQISYRQLEAPEVFYRVRIREISNLAEM